MIKLKDLLTEEDSNDRGGVLLKVMNKYLLCKSAGSGKWNIPKGHIMKGEDSRVGSVREFEEETQIKLEAVPKLLKKSEIKGNNFYIYIAETNQEEIPKLDFEHTDWGYFTLDNLPTPLHEAIEEVFDEIRYS